MDDKYISFFGWPMAIEFVLKLIFSISCATCYIIAYMGMSWSICFNATVDRALKLQKTTCRFLIF